MKLSSARRRCVSVLRDVEVPDPFDISAFCDSLAVRRGRRLHLHPFHVNVAALPCGMYLSLPEGDHIFFDGRTSPLHRDHIVMHEISHMLLGHATDAHLYETAGRLMPSIDQRTLEKVLARTSYSTEYEREAELLATLIAGAATSSSGVVEDVATAPIVGRLHTTLGHVSSSTRRP